MVTPPLASTRFAAGAAAETKIVPFPAPVLLLIWSAPLATVVSPVWVLAPLRTSVPAPVLVIPKAPPWTEPRVSVAFACGSKVDAPVIVVTPKVIAPVPEVASAPRVTERVCAPIVSVPSVCVTPAPATSRSETTVVLAVTVVARPKFKPVSFASWSVPLPKDNAPAPSAPVLVVARTMPAETVVVPVYVLTPESVKMPAPVFVMPPAPTMTPAMVVLPAPPLVRRNPPFVTPLRMLRRLLVELFVQDCAPLMVIATFCPAVAEPIVGAPAVEFTTMPLVPSVSTRFVPPPCSSVVPVLLKMSPAMDWFAFKLTVCAVLTSEILNCAMSAATGS